MKYFTIGKMSTNPVRMIFIKDRIDSAYYCDTPIITMASVGSKEQMVKRLKSLKNPASKWRDSLDGFEVLELVGEPLEAYLKDEKDREEWKQYKDQKCSLSVYLIANETTLHFATKKSLNTADKAVLELFKSMGLTVKKNDKGYSYIQVKVPKGGSR